MITESCYNVNPEREHVLVDNLKFSGLHFGIHTSEFK